jgi:capsular polysaccharide biosynthesis protein
MTDFAVDGVNSPRGQGSSRWRIWLSLFAAVLCVALGGLGGFAFHKKAPVEYRASTTLLVLPTAAGLDSSVAGNRSQTDVQIATEAELLRSSLVADAASKLLKGALSSKALLKNSAVTAPPNSQVLMVSLVAGTRTLARDGSMALAQAYLSQRNAGAQAQLDGTVKSLETQVADLTKRLEKNSAAQTAANPADSGQRELLASQRVLLVNTIADVNSRLVSLRLDTVHGGDIVTKAGLPDRPASPQLPLTVGAGLLVGILAAGGLLIGLNQLRTKRRAAATRQPATTRVPVLATLALGHPSTTEDSAGSQVVRFVDEDEVLRRLCMKISTHKGLPGPTVIVGVGDPLLRTRLGASLNRAWAAEFGSSVLVLTEDGAHIDEAIGISPSAPGLRDALRRDQGILETVTVPVGTYAGVVGPGRDPHLAPTAAQRGLLPEVWTLLEKEFGSVLVQTGSPLDSPVAQSVAVTAGRFVVLVEVGIGQQRDLTSTLEEIEWLDLSNRVAGVVIVSNHPAPPLVATDPYADLPEPFVRDNDQSGGSRDRG